MTILTVSNTSTSQVGVGQHVGNLRPGETKNIRVTVSDLEQSRRYLVPLEEAGVITWSTAPSIEAWDDDAEFVTVEDLSSPLTFSAPTHPDRTITFAMAANTNNYDDSGNLDAANLVRLDPTAGGFNLTGIAGGFPNRILHLVNVSANTVNLLHESGLSTLGNRIRTPGAVTLALTAYSACTLYYDAQVTYWVALGTSL